MSKPTEEDMEISALALVRQIAALTDPCGDSDDDANTLANIINRAREITVHPPELAGTVRFPAMRSKASADPHCTMCGAVHGMPHHDPDSAGVIVDLVDAETPSGKAALLCQICKAGVDEIRAESSEEPEPDDVDDSWDGEAEADLKLRGLQEDGEL